MTAPEWSLTGLRVLVGLACVEAPDALDSLLRTGRCEGAPRNCELVFGSVATGLASPGWRIAFDGLLAGLLARDAESLRRRSLYELAELQAQSALPRRTRLALVWLLGRHPCFAARRVEERVARGLAAA